MTLAPALVADVLVNLLGAGGALVLAGETRRADPRGPVSRRIAFALRFVAALFAVRALAWASGNGLAGMLEVGLAALVPLVSLIVAEGLLRRHAPRWLKLALIAGPALTLLVRVIPGAPLMLSIALLLATVVGGMLAVGALLWWRNADSLTTAENANIHRMLIGVLVLAPLMLTDFRTFWPDAPVRLGAVGALLLMYLALGADTVWSSIALRLGTLAMLLAIGGLLALGYVAASPAAGMDHLVRTTLVGFCGLLFSALLSEARGAQAERNRGAGRLTSARDPAEFLARLAEHPVLGGAQMLTGAALDHVCHPAFTEVLTEQRVLRRSAAPWGRAPSDDGVERALSLLSAYDATHLALLSAEPLRLLALSLPAVVSDGRTETEIEMARLVGELVHLKADRR